MGYITFCCPECSHTGSSEKPHAFIGEVLANPVIDVARGDFAWNPVKCGSCDHKFYPVAYINHIVTCHTFVDGKRWDLAEHDKMDAWWAPPPKQPVAEQAKRIEIRHAALSE